jgi:hypothetical protein
VVAAIHDAFVVTAIVGCIGIVRGAGRAKPAGAAIRTR